MFAHPARFATPALLFAALTACSSEKRQLHLDVTTGHETDTFSMDPPVTRILVTAKSPDGTTTIVATTTPGGTFDLGDVVETQSLGFEVTGYDIGGRTVVQGRSLGAISLLSIDDDGTVPVFVQRIGQWARPPGELVRAHVSAPSGTLGEQYVWQSGGTVFDAAGKADAKSSDFYDLFAMGGAEGPLLDRAPETIVSLGAVALILDAEGGTGLDFSAETKGDLTLPTGLDSFADVAGGQPVYGDNGTTYVVGATRATGTPTRAVLLINPGGTLSAATLHDARLGAAATWVPNLGLVVAGGSDTGAGVEVLPNQTTIFAKGPYPVDPVVGATAVLHPQKGDELQVLLLGGTNGGKAAPTRLLDLSCAKACSVSELASVTLPLGLHRVSAYVLTDDQLIAVGDEAGGMGPGQTRAFVIDLAAETVTETPLREPRKGASVIPSPLGTLAILGGLHLDETPAFTMETFFPP